MRTFRVTTFLTAAAMFLSGLQPGSAKLFDDSPPAAFPLTAAAETIEPETDPVPEEGEEPETAEEPAVTTAPAVTELFAPAETTITATPASYAAPTFSAEAAYIPTVTTPVEIGTVVLPETTTTAKATTETIVGTGYFVNDFPSALLAGATYTCYVGFAPGGVGSLLGIEQSGEGKVDIGEPYSAGDGIGYMFDIIGVEPGTVTLTVHTYRGDTHAVIDIRSMAPTTATTTKNADRTTTTAAATTKVSTTIVTTGTAHVMDDCPSEIRVSERVTCMVRSVPYGTVEVKTITQKGEGSVEIRDLVNDNGCASFEIAGERAGKVTLTLAINHLRFSYNYTIDLTVTDAWAVVTTTTSATTASSSTTTSATTESTPILTGTAHIAADCPTKIKVGETVTCEVRSVPYGTVRVEGIEQDGSGKISVVSIDNSQGYAVIKIRGEQAGTLRLIFKTDRYDVSANLTVTKKNGERMLGDLDGNSDRNVSDAVLLARLAGGDSTLVIGDEYRANADIDGDGEFSVLDLSLLLQAIVGKITLTDN